MADNLAACVRELVAWPVKPTTVIVNGDLAFKSGLPEDYATFGKLIEPVRALAPVHLSLGNHDERENFWQAFPHDATMLKSVPQKQASVFTSDRANWFLLDSLESTDSTPGELGAAQLDWLDHELKARRANRRSLLAHHNLRHCQHCHRPERIRRRWRKYSPVTGRSRRSSSATRTTGTSASTRAACISSTCRRRATCSMKAGRAAGCAPRSRATARKLNCAASTRNIPNMRR